MEKMNELAKQQEELGNQMKTIWVNSKKDSSKRKTEVYIQNRLDELEEKWKIIQKNHEKMTQMGKSHIYFTTNYYEQLQKLYEETKNYLMTCEKAKPEEKSEEKPKSQQQLSDQDGKLRKQDFKINQLQKELKKIREELQEEKPKIRYKFLLTKIQNQWEIIQELNEDIELNEEKFEHPYFTKNMYDEIEKQYEKVIQLLQEKLNEKAEDKTNVALPQIKIPIFDGQYENWNTFRDLFGKVIHDNASISKIEKMQYLKTHLKREPSKLIQHLQVSEANYQTAWDLLNKRYENNRILLTKLIDKILDLPKLQQESFHELKRLHDTIRECLEAIKNLGFDTRGPILARIITRKWDPETNRIYEQSLTHPHEIQDFETIMEFLQKRFQSLETTTEKTKEKIKKDFRRCKFCEESHSIYSCQKFKALPPEERMKAIKNKQLCTTCLNHESNKKCFSNNRCKNCNGRHNTLLHREYVSTNNKSGPSKTTQNQDNGKQEQANKISGHVGRQDQAVILATALIRAKNSAGAYEYLRALIDPGSQISLITEEAASLLGLPREKIQAEISGLGAGKPNKSKSKICVQCIPRFPSQFNLTTEFLVLPKLTQSLPEQDMKIDMDQWNNYLLADPSFCKVGPIDAILGAKEYCKIIQDGLKKTDNGLMGQNTHFGWTIYGCSSAQTNKTIQAIAMTARIEEEKELSKFWELEEIPVKRNLTEEEISCENHFKKTVRRDENGRYTVRIPFKKEKPHLGESRQRAVARLLQLENKLAKNEELSREYKEFMQEYIDLGHMVKIPQTKQKTGKYYIPHQAVLRESSTTTKLRVVFDASSKTSNGVSLNETMCIGAKLQQELADIILRWRTHQVAITADIEKMYRQINIHPDDQDFHRILWRFNTNEPIEEYNLTTLTYGTASAPYLAIRVIHQMAKDEETTFPRASEITKRDFYVDDLLSGADTEAEAIKLQNELIELMKKGGFTLRKWSSNKPQVLEKLPEELRDQSTIEIKQDDTKKSLGIHWAPFDDSIRFKVELSTNKKTTKRAILSDSAKIFDPLGWISPVVIRAKMLIQELWCQKLDWDDQVPQQIQETWTSFRNQLKHLENIVIPRWTFQTKNSKIELHGFCDASEKAYGAAVYLKTSYESEIKITLLTAKSKVAPIKTKTTLPRLELCAAVLLARLMKTVKTAIKSENTVIYAWTDSMITLGWIQGQPSKWKTFVANRVAEIQEALPASSWNHVKSEDNPADLISRGMNPAKLQNCHIWWQGPEWLKNKKDIIPQPVEYQTSKEMNLCHHITKTQDEDEIYTRFSSLSRMLRVVAYCRKFIKNCKKEATEKGRLTVKEIEDAQKQIIKMVQHNTFKREIKELTKKASVEKDSKLLNLHPFLDQEGLMRVGGRLEHTLLKYTEKHPIILPNNNHVTRLIISDAHLKTLHGGNQLTLTYTRQKFWIVNGKKAVKSVIMKCTKCLRYKAQTSQQLMGQLPSPRVIPAAAFINAGVDYAGPIQIRTTKGRGHKSIKGYIAIFICLSTKAVHLEVASDMSSEAFLAAFRRFISRRGPCAHLYSDNGTNFVGAKRIMEDEISIMIEKSNVPDKIALTGTQWHFIPPATPHFGGIWEAAVKSMKYHLKRVVGESTLTYEELSTLTSQIEACLNSRPLCPVSDDINSISVLTPAHFLIGREIISPQIQDTSDCNPNLSERWMLIQKMKKDFWKTWSSEYLNQLQQRYKWKLQHENLKPGQIVIVKEENINPSKWPLAKIEETHAAPDNKVRVVTLKKPGGATTKRPIHKLIPLPEEQNENQEKLTETHSVNISRATNLKRKNTSWKIILLAILFICKLTKATSAPYQITYPKPGMFVEHVGHAKINRGVFRIEIKFEKSQMENDSRTITQTVKQMEDFCKKATDLSANTECASLVNHLKEKEKEKDWLMKGLNRVISNREERGLLGDMLTSIFGVNDEVYKDIEELDKNQHELIRASNHQTKFMLQALSRFNETEIRVEKKLNSFRKKLNEGLQAINDMQPWYRTVNENKLSIHLLSTYQLAENYIEEQLQRYKKLLDIHFNTDRFYEFMTPAQVDNIIEKASQKLPSNIQITSYPILKAEVQHSEHYIHVFGYFTMCEINDFLIIKVTPTPLKINNGTYWILDLVEEFLAIDYNNQLFFQQTEEDLRNSVQPKKHHYICSPAIIHNIQSSPNCIIDEIYQRSNTTCQVKQKKLKETIWKQLYTQNTWLFITPTATRVAITCNGIREEETLVEAGIISISQSCVINTKKNVLTPKRQTSFPVLASFSKPVVANLTMSKISQPHIIAQEAVIKASDPLNDLKDNEESIRDELQENVWKTVKHHSTTTSIVTAVAVVSVIIIIWVIKKLIQTRQHSKSHNRRSTKTENNEFEMVELNPIQLPTEDQS